MFLTCSRMCSEGCCSTSQQRSWTTRMCCIIHIQFYGCFYDVIYSLHHKWKKNSQETYLKQFIALGACLLFAVLIRFLYRRPGKRRRRLSGIVASRVTEILRMPSYEQRMPQYPLGGYWGRWRRSDSRESHSCSLSLPNGARRVPVPGPGRSRL